MATERFKRNLLFFCAILPLLSLIATGAMWIDTRYTHRTISDIRNVSLQIRLVEMKIEDLELRMANGDVLTPTETRVYNMHLKELETLNDERKRILGINE